MRDVVSVQREQMTDDTLTVANKWCDGLSFWPGGVLEEAVSQLIPAEGEQKGKLPISFSHTAW